MYSTPTVSAASSSPAKTNDFMLSPRKFGPGQDRGSSRDGGYAEVSYRVLNRPTNGAAVQANTHSRLAAEPSQSPQRYWQVEPLTGENPRKEQTTAQDSVVATSGSARESLRGLAAERDRLQRQVQEMRTDVSNARQDLSTQHARQKVQTDELRTTLQDLQADTERLQTEQRRQATALKNSLKVGDSSRLEKQVEGVASIVKSQEQRFDRLENDIGSAYESQRLQLQQALAENRQLAKGLEEDSQRRANMMMELVEKATRTGNASQLSAELANATNAIQGQTSDWSVLSRQIHSDVSGLSLEMKADRDARAVEASTRRMEVLKMMEDARRQGALEALGICEAGLSESHVLNGAQDMLSRPGFVAVQHLVDLNCKILRDMESQLIIRAGFLANIFHFWRCEATLLKTGRYYQDEFQKNQDDWEAHLANHRRSFEEELVLAADKASAHKEHVRGQHDLLLRQWALGEAKGLFAQTFKSWFQLVVKEKQRKRNAANIHKACLQWVEGKTKGLKHSCFSAWHHEAKTEALHRQRDEDLDKVKGEAERRLEERLSELDHIKVGTRKAIETAVAKWKNGSAKGMEAMCFRAMKENCVQCRAKKAKRNSVEMCVKKFLLGQARGVLSTCWLSWKKDALESQRLAAEHKRFEDFLDGERAKMRLEYQNKLSEKDLRIAAAHECVGLVVKKWILGDAEGLKVQVYQVWSKWALRRAEDEKKLASVHMALSKWARGDAKGVLQTVFSSWKHDASVAAGERKTEAALDVEREKMERYLEDERKRHGDELNKYKTEAELLKARAHQAVLDSVDKWILGNEKGSVKAAFTAWNSFSKQSKSSERARQAVHASLRQALLGKDKAAVVNAFKNWLSLTKSEKAERDREQILADQKKHWEEETDRLRNQFDKEMRGTMTEHEKLKAQAQAQTELVLRRWLSMNELDISEHFVMWRRYTAATKDSSRKRNAVKDAMSRFLEGERRGVMHSTFTGWKTHVAQAAKDNSQIRKLEEQVERLLRKQEQSVQKYGTFLASKSGPAMKGLVFRRWFELSQGEKQRAELEREREVQLEEMARKHKMEETRKKEMRAKALHNLGVKGGRAVLLEVFLAWSYEYQKNKEVRCHKMNENQALVNYSKYILGKKLKEDSHALLASSFSEWRREGKILRHEDAMNTLEERDVYIAQLKAGFEEQLALAYQQIDQITETLQKELQTKEELAHELREAYEKNRKMNLPDYPVTPGSATPGSTRRRQTSTERRGTSVGSNVSRPARHSLPGSSLTKERETFFAGGLAQVSEPLAFQRPATTGHLQPPNGSASRSTSPRRDVNWDSVVDRLENRGVVSGRRLI